MTLFNKKNFNTLFKNRQLKHNPDEVIFNYSKISLSDTEKSLVVRGFRFSLPPMKLNYADYLTNSELFYRSRRNLDILSNGDLEFVKTKIKDPALSSFHFHNATVPQYLSDEVLQALDRLSKNKNLVIQKADKSNSVVLVNRDVYVKHMANILKDNTKFEKVDIKTRVLNVQVNHEKRLNEILKRLKYAGSLSDKQYKIIKAIESRPGVLNGLCKTHKVMADVCPLFRPIVSAIGTPTYKTAKFRVPIPSCLTINESIVKDTFSFRK